MEARGHRAGGEYAVCTAKISKGLPPPEQSLRKRPPPRSGGKHRQALPRVRGACALSPACGAGGAASAHRGADDGWHTGIYRWELCPVDVQGLQKGRFYWSFCGLLLGLEKTIGGLWQDRWKAIQAGMPHWWSFRGLRGDLYPVFRRATC